MVVVTGGPGDRATEATLGLLLDRLRMRPGQLPGRSPVHTVLETGSAGAPVHLVTSGRVFYLTSYSVVLVNPSTAALLEARLRDGSEGPARRTWHVPARKSTVVGAPVPPDVLFYLTEMLPEPIPFESSAFLELAGPSGVSARLSISGYEEGVA